MSKLNELLVSLASTTPGEWWEDDDGFIASGSQEEYKTVVDARCDEVELYADANTEFVILAKNYMPDLLYAVQILHKMVLVDEKGSDAFFEHGAEARSALRKLGVRI